MLLFVSILVLSIVVFFVMYNVLTTWFKSRQQDLKDEHNKLVDQLVRMDTERRNLGSQLAVLEKKLNFLKHDITPKANLAKGIQLPEDETSLDVRMGDYMITQSLITIEQHAKAMKMLDQLKMDFTAVCHTLGFIDSAQAKSIKKQIR